MKGRRNILAVTVAGLLVASPAVARLGAQWPLQSAMAPAIVDTNVVVVLPFTAGGSDPARADLRDWLQVLLIDRLTGEGSPRALPATSVGHAAGAAEALSGSLVATANRVFIEGRLLPARGGVVGAPARVEGSADSLPYLADRLVTLLLASRAATGEDDFAVLSSTTLAVLRAYLAGRALYHRGKVHEAEEYFNTALLLDSNFTAAGLAIATLQANYWRWRAGSERWLADAVWRQRGRMTIADRALLVAHLGPRYPEPSSHVEKIAAAVEAARVGPGRIESQFYLGSLLQNLGPVIETTDWKIRSSTAFRRAFALDSSHGPTLSELAKEAAVARDSASVRRYARLYLTHNPGGVSAQLLRWLAAVVGRDSAAVVRSRSEFGTLNQSLREIVEFGQAAGMATDDVDRASRASLGMKASAVGHGHALLDRAQWLLNGGRPEEARRLLGEFKPGTFTWMVRLGQSEFRIYAHLYWDGDSTDAAHVVRQLELFPGGTRSNSQDRSDPQSRNCALAHWYLASGDVAGATAAIRRVGRIARADPFWSPATEVCVAAANAMLAAALRRPDSGLRLARLESMLRNRRGGASDHVHAAGDLVAARLHEQRGDLPHALTALRRITGSFLSTRLREEGRLATLTGDYQGAVRAYRHYLDFRYDPEPTLAPDVSEVRNELRRLERKLGS